MQNNNHTTFYVFITFSFYLLIFLKEHMGDYKKNDTKQFFSLNKK